MKTIIILAAILSLSACAHRPQPIQPIIDTANMSEASKVSYAKDLNACRSVVAKIPPPGFLEVFGSSDVRRDEQRREEKKATVLRNCLQARGHVVLY